MAIPGFLNTGYRDAALGGPETYDYNLYRRQGRRALQEQRGAALGAIGEQTGGELVGLPGYAAGSIGPGYLQRLRRDVLRRSASRVGSAFSQLGGEQAQREQDFLADLLKRRLEAKYQKDLAKAQRPGIASTIAGTVGTLGGAYLGRPGG